VAPLWVIARLCETGLRPLRAEMRPVPLQWDGNSARGSRAGVVGEDPPYIRRPSLRLPLPLRRGPKALLCQGGRRKARSESTPPDPRLGPPKMASERRVDDAEGRGDAR
jgi:hypothetical protein